MYETKPNQYNPTNTNKITLCWLFVREEDLFHAAIYSRTTPWNNHSSSSNSVNRNLIVYHCLCTTNSLGLNLGVSRILSAHSYKQVHIVSLHHLHEASLSAWSDGHHVNKYIRYVYGRSSTTTWILDWFMGAALIANLRPFLLFLLVSLQCIQNLEVIQ